jgi:sigma-B regulation protein RsbU (phosphoserine phosphatase)
VIEDDKAILRGLADNLRFESYDVLTSGDGREGYRLVCDERPDLVILDLMLPGLNGYEVCRQMRGKGIETPVLMLTADDQESSRVRAFDAGIDDYVSKPFSTMELLGRVRAILRRTAGRTDSVHQRDHQRDMGEARRIQAGLMPAEIPRVPGLRFDAVWRPAGTVGGDYFDVLKLGSNTVAVCIGDVCGKGIPAAMLMSNLQAAVRAIASEDISPRDLCGKVNRLTCANTSIKTFVSFFYAVIDSDRAGRRRLTYCNAGHNPPILFDRPGAARKLECGGGILGVFPDWGYAEQEVYLEGQERLLMYTDGVTESRNAAGEEFGEHRLIDFVRHWQDNEPAKPARLSESIVSAVRDFNRGLFEDDLTVLAVAIE